MMMLHTDAFNRHNKNKMTKADYVRNTRMDGVSPLVLEVGRVVQNRSRLISGLLRQHHLYPVRVHRRRVGPSPVCRTRYGVDLHNDNFFAAPLGTQE